MALSVGLTEREKYIVSLALSEDMGSGDVTVEALGVGDVLCSGRVLAREEGVLAGLEVFAEVFKQLDEEISIETEIEDGDIFTSGKQVAMVKGRASAVLSAERTALNFLSHLSGVATATWELKQIVGEGPPFIRDTRKTTPGLREMEKKAVLAGGGCNHRMGLFDAILVKDNHLKLLPLRQALEAAKEEGRSRDLVVEVEVENMGELKEALEMGADIVMLDNMGPDQVREAVVASGDRVILEASGGINQKNIRDFCIPGLSYISLGAITQSAKAIDFSFELDVVDGG